MTDGSITVRGGTNTPLAAIYDREFTLEAGERRRVWLPDGGSDRLYSLDVRLEPRTPAADVHAYRVDGVGIDGGESFVVIEETGGDAGGSVRVVVTAA